MRLSQRLIIRIRHSTRRSTHLSAALADIRVLIRAYHATDMRLPARNPDTCQKHDRRPNKEFTWNGRIHTPTICQTRRRLAATLEIHGISGNASLR